MAGAEVVYRKNVCNNESIDLNENIKIEDNRKLADYCFELKR